MDIAFKQKEEACDIVETEDDNGFCIVNNDDICIDDPYNMKHSDSMNNLFDREELNHMDISGENVGDAFYETTEQMEPKVSCEDLHSNPSSATLTNISSSTSNQYQTSGDRIQPFCQHSSGLGDVGERFTNSGIASEEMLHSQRNNCTIPELENLSQLSKEELIQLVHRLSATVCQQRVDNGN